MVNKDDYNVICYNIIILVMMSTASMRSSQRREKFIYMNDGEAGAPFYLKRRQFVDFLTTSRS